ncbi:hypothetical protein BGZ73_005616 [Actinomortierella ambigua]|nr:hypothetical protein BGZ73_005616 [Actinomortierella ambigua]
MTETTILEPLGSTIFSRPLFIVNMSTSTSTFDTVFGTWIPNTDDTAKSSSPTRISLTQGTIQQEIAPFRRLQHPHLIQFHETGKQDGKVFTAMEAFVKDTLSALIKGRELDWPTRYRIVLETAKGLEYLHDNGVIHRDLRSDNVLLTESMVVKLCGFGSASTKSASTRILTNSDDDTVRWMAPELFIGIPLFSTKSDVFAFGMVMWQMAATSMMPLEAHDSSQAATRIQDGRRDEIPNDTPTEYRMTIEQCWDQDPNKRPRASAMVTLSMQSRSVESLETKMMTFRKDLSEAFKVQPDLPSSSQSPTSQGERVEIQSMLTIEANAMKNELHKRLEELEFFRRPEGNAKRIFDEDVSCNSSDAMKKWSTTRKVVVDEAGMRSVRFGHLGTATIKDKTVMVKRVSQIQGTTKLNTIKRCKALAHWLKDCKGIMKIDIIHEPDLVIYGPINCLTLDVYLATHPELSPEAKWILTFKLASIISYIHKCGIIHRNIRAESVFMVEETPGIEPKLSGFEICHREGVAFRVIGPVGVLDVWDAPEKQSYGSSFETDVFAFGVLMYEITMQKPPAWVDEYSGTMDRKFASNVNQWIAQAHAFNPSSKYTELMQRCLSVVSTDRPKMAAIFDTLAEGYD